MHKRVVDQGGIAERKTILDTLQKLIEGD